MQRSTLILAGAILLLATQAAGNSAFLGHVELVPDASYVGSEACLDCHEEKGEFYSKSPHAVERNLTVPGTAIGGCEACHGPGSKHIEEEEGTFILGSEILSGLDEAGRADMCTQCHLTQGTEWSNGPHSDSGITCSDCHADQVHFGGEATPAANFGNPAEFCLQCHPEQVGDFRMPFRHRVLEGQITCGDCHDPHAGPADTGWNDLNDTCTSCHIEMAGPYVFEHEGVADEDCTVCHYPHGSMNDKLLVSDGNTLCLQCHFDIESTVGVLGDESFPHENMPANCAECHDGAVGLTGSPHAFLTSSGESRCYDCHYEIHGSNVSETLGNQ